MSKTPYRTRQALALLATGDRGETTQTGNGTSYVTPDEMARRADIFERTGYGAMIKFFGDQVLPWLIEELVTRKLKAISPQAAEKLTSYVRMIEYVVQKYATNQERQLSDATSVVLAEVPPKAKGPEATLWLAGIEKYLPGYYKEGDIVGTLQQIEYSLRLTGGMSYADKVFLVGWTYYCFGVAPDAVWTELGIDPEHLASAKEAAQAHIERKYEKAPEEVPRATTRSSVFGGPGVLEQTYGPPRNAAEREAYDILYGTYGDSGLRDIIGLFDLIYKKRAKGV